MLKLLREHHNPQQGDLIDIFGLQDYLSEVLHGIRELELKQIKKLSKNSIWIVRFFD